MLFVIIFCISLFFWFIFILFIIIFLMKKVIIFGNVDGIIYELIIFSNFLFLVIWFLIILDVSILLFILLFIIVKIINWWFFFVKLVICVKLDNLMLWYMEVEGIYLEIKFLIWVCNEVLYKLLSRIFSKLCLKL